jgi:uncharacterized domain HDIG
MTRSETSIYTRRQKFKLIMVRLVMFLTAVLVIAYFFPREGKFKYQFQAGKPWKYGLLTASFTFPIYKTDEQVKREQDSLLKDFRPYYKVNLTTSDAEKSRLFNDYNTTLNTKINSAHLKYIENALIHIYTVGVVSANDLNKLQAENITEMRAVEGNMSKERVLSTLFTVKTAYEYIINNAPGFLDKTSLQECGLNNYLTENLTYDEKTSERVKKEMISTLSLTSGVVQAGERIIDRGEIISDHTYNILRSLKIEYEQRSGTVQQTSWEIIGEVILISSLFTFMFLYLFLFRYQTFERIRLLFFILLMITGMAIITALNAQYKLFSIYVVPFAIVPIIVRTFFDSRTALFTHFITVLICSFMAPFPFEFMLLQITVGMTAVSTLKDLTQRSQLVQSSVLTTLTYLLIYLGYALIQEGNWEKLNWHMFIYFLVNGLLLLFAYLLIYIFEKIFGFVSHVTLVELSNINSPFLRKFSEECPGTFHHSLQVSNLAVEAAMRVNANTQLIRTAALYHDIGKMENPVFFTENQTGVNPHDKLEIEQSVQIIINHVKDGVRLAQKIGLPDQIIDFIYTHHGTSRAKYFYNSFKNKYPDREIDESLFTYPGPNPFTKETAILMMADAVEASTRSITEFTEESLTSMVEKVINNQIQDGLFKNAPITLRDIETIKQLFIEKLQTYYHTRISYPDLKKE